MDYNFTAQVEKEFDEIAKGVVQWPIMLKEFYIPFHKSVEDTLENSERATGERELGTHPESNRRVIARIGRFGPMIQVGDEKLDGEKPKFASLRKNQSINSITLEEALELFKLPRTLGEYEGSPIKANVGRFGPYVQQGSLFASLPEEDDPMTVNLDRAIELIILKKEEDAKRIIKEFPENEEVLLLHGRWGPFLKIGKRNYKLPKDAEPEKLTLEECITISENQPAPKRKQAKKKKK
jgi:DNA topoisomerase-1